MIREMQALFGEEFWNFTIIGVSHWAYDAQSVNSRNYTGQTEEKFMNLWNNLLEEKFHLSKTVQGVFIDSWSQQVNCLVFFPKIFNIKGELEKVYKLRLKFS